MKIYALALLAISAFAVTVNEGEDCPAVIAAAQAEAELAEQAESPPLALDLAEARDLCDKEFNNCWNTKLESGEYEKKCDAKKACRSVRKECNKAARMALRGKTYTPNTLAQVNAEFLRRKSMSSH